VYYFNTKTLTRKMPLSEKREDTYCSVVVQQHDPRACRIPCTHSHYCWNMKDSTLLPNKATQIFI